MHGGWALRVLGTRGATDLAAFRILTVLAWLATVNPRLSAHFAAYPCELVFPPGGWAWVRAWLPVSPTAVWAGYGVFVCAAAAVLAGWRTRRALVVMLLSGGAVLTIPQFYGKIEHCNHLVWFALLLIASPCGDALSIDARGKGAAAVPSERYAMPLLVAVLLVGVAYFFPGFWKLIRVGWEWTQPEHLANLLRGKWTEFGAWTPAWRVDEWPWGLKVGGVATIVFEMCFVPLALWRRTRGLAIVAGVAFHVSVLMLMRIELWTLLAGYSGLVRWGRFGGVNADDTDGTRWAWPVGVVGAVLIAGNIHNGVKGRDWWPLGQYPTFAFIAEPEVERLEVRAEFPDGRVWVLTEAMLGERSSPSRARGLCARILESPRRMELMQAYVELWRRLEPSLNNAIEVTARGVIVPSGSRRAGR